MEATLSAEIWSFVVLNLDRCQDLWMLSQTGKELNSMLSMGGMEGRSIWLKLGVRVTGHRVEELPFDEHSPLFSSWLRCLVCPWSARPRPLSLDVMEFHPVEVVMERRIVPFGREELIYQVKLSPFHPGPQCIQYIMQSRPMGLGNVMQEFDASEMPVMPYSNRELEALLRKQDIFKMHLSVRSPSFIPVTCGA